jgi:hypothetical protein
VSVETADVVIVGGGVHGCSLAYALAARGVKRVILLEQGALAHGASGRSSALVRMHYTNEWDARLAWASFPVFRHWAELMGGPPVFTHTGFVNVVAPEYAEALRKNVEMLRGIGINTTALTPAELLDLQPFAAVDDLGAAAYEPDSGYASPVDVVEGFARRARELGAEAQRRRDSFACVAFAPDLEATTRDSAERTLHATERVPSMSLVEQLGALLRRAARSSDAVGRLGQAEFAIVSTGIKTAGAARLARRLQLLVDDAHLDLERAGSSLRVSAGYYAIDDFANAAVDPAEVLVRATTALREARSSRNSGEIRVYQDLSTHRLPSDPSRKAPNLL